MKRITGLCLALLLAATGCEPESLRVDNPPLARAADARPVEIASRTEARPGVTVVELANGMTVIVGENHNAPVVCVEAFVSTGGLYEGKYLGCGISHLTEHLVAKGAVHDMGPGATAKESKQTSDRVDRIGGQSNAFTSLDKTAYYIAATAGKTDECIDLLADWMARPDITRVDFDREHQVVQRELEMGKDDARRQMWYAHARNVYGAHPAGVPVIGYPGPLAGLKYEDVLDYQRSRYVPQNMVFAVVGDVDTEKVLARVRVAMAGFDRGRSPMLVLPEVAPAAETRRVTFVHRSATEASENLSFLTIPLVHEDLYALDVLSDILANGESSRLVRKIQREDKLVTAISSSSWTPEWGRGQFTVGFRGQPDRIDAAERAVLAELRKALAEPVTPEELARAKRQKVADWVYSQQTVESQAGTLGGDFLSTGDANFSRTYTDRIQKVTVEAVQAAAKKYFDFEAMIITRMLPPGAAGAAAAGGQAVGAGQTKTFTLDNGLRVILHASSAVDLVSATLATEGGLLTETPPTNGMGTLMTGLSDKGAGKRSAEQIAEFFDSAGGSIGGACGNNTFYWRTTVLGDSWVKALPIFADVVLRPTYPQKELDILRPVLTAQIKRIDESWSGQLNRRFRQDFFRDSPLAMLTAGIVEVIDKATPTSVVAWHAEHVKAGSSVLAIYGHFDLDKTAEAVRKLFAAMPKGANRIPDVAARRIAPDGETYVHPSDLKGAAAIVAVPGMKVTNLDDRLPMTVLDTIISGYQLPRGWLHEELRGKGLVYVVHAYNAPALVPGAFITYAQCETDKAPEVAAIIRKNLRATVGHAYSQAEVDEAVNIILTADLLDAQTMGDLAMQAALDELYGFGWDFRKKYEKLLRAVTPEDVAGVARKYFSGGYLTTVVTPAPAAFKVSSGNGDKK